MSSGRASRSDGAAAVHWVRMPGQREVASSDLADSTSAHAAMSALGQGGLKDPWTYALESLAADLPVARMSA